MSQPSVPYPLLIIYWQKTNYLLINQFREIDFINILYSPSFEHYGLVIFVDYGAVGLFKHHIITIVKKLTDTQKVMFKTIYKPHIINRDRGITNSSCTNDLARLVASKLHISSFFHCEGEEHWLLSCHVPWETNVQIPWFLLLGMSAVLTISDLGTNCFMGPLGLVLEFLLFTSCALRCGFGSFWLTITLGLTPFGFDSPKAVAVLFFWNLDFKTPFSGFNRL